MKQHAIENNVKTIKLPALLGGHTVTNDDMNKLRNFFINWYKITDIKNICIEYKLVNKCDLYRMIIDATCSVQGKVETVPGYFCTKWVVSTSSSNVYYLLIDEMKILLEKMSTKHTPYAATKGIARMGKPRIKRRWVIG